MQRLCLATRATGAGDLHGGEIGVEAVSPPTLDRGRRAKQSIDGPGYAPTALPPALQELHLNLHPAPKTLSIAAFLTALVAPRPKKNTQTQAPIDD